MSHPRRHLSYPLLLAALLLPRLPARAQEQKPPPVDLQAIGVPLDQLPHAEALLQAQLDRLKAAGEPVTAAELAGSPIPDEGNAALVYRQAFAALKFARPGEGTPVPPRLIGRGTAPPPPAPAPLPQPGAAPPVPAVPGAPELPAAVDENHWVAGNLEAIALLEKAAQLPRSRWPYDWTKGPGNFLSLPDYSQLRTCSGLLAAKMRIETRGGSLDEALQTCAVSLALPRSLERAPSLISDLVTAALYAISTDGLRRCLGLEKPAVRLLYPAGVAPEAPPLLPSTPACRALFLRLAQVDLRTPLHWALLGERVETAATLDGIRAQAAAAPAKPTAPGAKLNEMESLYTSPQGMQVLMLDEAMYLRVMAEIIQAADLPSGPRRAALAALDARTQALPLCYMFTKMSTGIFSSRFFFKTDQTATELARSQIALALVAYHNETGQWPATLDQLHKVVAWDLPLDPFSGKDFLYRREGEGWVLYSVGANQKDDGGTGDDMVWRKK